MSAQYSDPPAPTPPENASPAALMRWNIDVVNSHQVAPRRVLWTPQTYARFPDRTLRGPDEIAGWFTDLHTAVPDLTMTILSLVEDAGHVLMRWRLTGTHSGGELAGLAPTGARLDVDGVDDAVFDGGRIASVFVVYDQMQLARQVGLLPAEGSRLDVSAKRAFNLLRRARR